MERNRKQQAERRIAAESQRREDADRRSRGGGGSGASSHYRGGDRGDSTRAGFGAWNAKSGAHAAGGSNPPAARVSHILQHSSNAARGPIAGGVSIGGARQSLGVVPRAQQRAGVGGDSAGGLFSRRKRVAARNSSRQPRALVVIIEDGMTLRQLAIQLRVTTARLSGRFAAAGETVSAPTDVVDGDVAELICSDMGARVRRVTSALRDRVRTTPPSADVLRAAGATLRAPVITVMGHVDHGKTSLLDALRRARVAAGEAGGITQSLAAFSVAMKAASVGTGVVRAPGGKAEKSTTAVTADGAAEQRQRNVDFNRQRVSVDIGDGDTGLAGGEDGEASDSSFVRSGGRVRGAKARSEAKRIEAKKAAAARRESARDAAVTAAASALADKAASGGGLPALGAADVMTFIDTPGHALFASMREQGAQVTDLVVLVVDGRDGVMPQTRESVQLILSAGARAVVAVTKCDGSVDPAQAVAMASEQLLAEGLVVESYGGDVPIVAVSARTGLGLEDLKTTLALLADVADLRARTDAPGEAVVLDSRPIHGLGQVVDCIVRWGTLRVGDIVVAANEMGRVKALFTDAVAAVSLSRRITGVKEAARGAGGGGKKGGGAADPTSGGGGVFKATPVKEALPGTPVRVVGLRGAPAAGEDLLVVPSEEAGKAVLDGRARRAAAKAALAVAATDAVIRAAARNEYKLKRTRKVALTLATQRERSRAALKKSGIPTPERLIEQPWETAILAEGRAGGVVGMSATGRTQRQQGGQQLDLVHSFAAVSTAMEDGDGDGVTAEALAHAQAIPAIAFSLKADSTGALAALSAAFTRIASADARLAPRVVAAAVGDFSEKDVEYAAEFKAHLVGFGAKIPAAVAKVADRKDVKVRTSRVIYHVLDEVLELLADYLPSEMTETVVSVADVKSVFALRGKRDDVTNVAGCAIIEGTFTKSATLYRVIRDGDVVHEAKAVSSLQQLKERVESVSKGKECGVGLADWGEFAAGDKIVAVSLTKKKANLKVKWD